MKLFNERLICRIVYIYLTNNFDHKNSFPPRLTLYAILKYYFYLCHLRTSSLLLYGQFESPHPLPLYQNPLLTSSTNKNLHQILHSRDYTARLLYTPIHLNPNHILSRPRNIHYHLVSLPMSNLALPLIRSNTDYNVIFIFDLPFSSPTQFGILMEFYL